MDGKRAILENTFTKTYESERFTQFIKEFFNNCTIVSKVYKDYWNWSEFSYYMNCYTHIGNYIDQDKNKIAIFAVELKKNRNVERARSMQRNFISKLLSKANYDAAIVAFYSEDEPKWRLSLVRLDYEFAKGRVKSKLTPAKRYSYLVGEKEPCHTAKERLLPIFENDKFNPTLDNIEEAFNVEKVTEEFFKKYREKYCELKDHLDESNDFNEEAEKHNFTSEQFAKKLMGQLAFLYFIQKKGWLGVKVLPHVINDKQYKNAYYNNNKSARRIVPQVYKQVSENSYKLNYEELKKLNDDDSDILAGCFTSEKWGSGEKGFIRHLYSNCKKVKEKEEKNFFDDYLEPLFYEALNHKRGDNNYYNKFNCKIPFLNGGLFEPLENYDWKNSTFEIPNELFSNIDIKDEENADGILDIFDRYNFTMNEDEPLEREVAVDPEMLGKIFENLLDVKDRKSKGAFYTPREIVHYMCQESLVNYLVNETGIEYEDIKDFIIYGEIMKDEDTGKEVKLGTEQMQIPLSVYNNIKLIDDKLADVRIADPAVGSGAFPMGMISEIVKARNNITEYFVAQYVITKEMTDSEKKLKQSQRARLYENRNPYKLKRNIIKNSIYAVDIEASAVDITKLRIWLSLVVDEDLEPTYDDIIMGFDKQKDPQALPNLDYNIMCGNSLIDEFEGIKLFDESILDKKEHTSKSEISNWQVSLFNDNIEKLLEDLFKEQDRFYGEDDSKHKLEIKKNIEKIVDDMIRLKLANDNNSEGLEKYEESLKAKTKPYFLWKLEFGKVFKDKGGFDIIIGNPPYGAKFDSKTKKILNKKYINVPDYESADYFIYKGMEMLKISGYISYIIPNTILSNLHAEKLRKDLVHTWQINFIDNLSEIDVFESAKVRTCILALKNYFSDNYKVKFSNPIINSGVYSVLNKKEIEKSSLIKNSNNWLNIFYKDEKTINLVNKLKENSIQLGIISEISQGLIPYDKYRGHSEETIKNRIWHSSCKKDETFKKELQGKDIERYKLHWNGQTWISYGEWLAAPRKKEFFTYKRILVREITNPRILATIVDEEYYNTPSIINIINIKNVDYKYILGLLNSKLMSYYHINTSPKANKGLFPKILVNDIRNLPIKLTDDNRMKQIVKLVDNILDKEIDDIKSIEKCIDDMVYTIYELSDVEIQEIENYFN
ncbi:Eco57I restriction-modification methylase domain-containing protein [Candidatus Clostridium helianthi]|uniref:site-specific DNA-methyltransferase (adenine-specific) n=1 Tax=Candidatus Clostridium helianthi TaxID=3381660 RepID=A0ABW8SDG2_9CLOT